MKLALGFGLALTTAVASSTAVAQQREIAGGLTLQQAKSKDGKAISFVRVALDKFDVRVVVPQVALAPAGSAPSDANRSTRVRGLPLREYRRRFTAAAVMSGGYLDSYLPPRSLGFVKSNGTKESPTVTTWVTEALFCSDRGKVSVQPIGQLTDRPEFRDCLQAGPMILQKGAAPTDSASVKDKGYPAYAQMVTERGFLCTDANGRVVIGVSEKMTLPNLTDLLRRSEVGCVDAMGLTGADTAGLLTRTEIFGRDNYLYPNAIAVIAHAP